MTPERVLNELTSEGWFQKGDNGWHRPVKGPSTVGGLVRFVYLVKTLGARCVSSRGTPAPVEVKTGPGMYDLMFRALQEKS